MGARARDIAEVWRYENALTIADLTEYVPGRFFEDDAVSPGSGFETNIYQVLGFLMTVGFLSPTGDAGVSGALVQKVHTPAVDWACEASVLFFPALLSR